MNQTLQLRYIHADHTSVLKDVRREQTSEVKWAHVYYVGFRISAGRDERYHHALILADDYDIFLDGVAGEYNAIRKLSRTTSFNDISLVFVRNLMRIDPDIVASADSQSITSDIRDELSRCDKNEYLVFGLVGEQKICLVQVNNCEALLAIDRVRTMCMDKFKEEFMPLEVCQAHPVTTECYALFDAAAERIKALVSNLSAGSGYLH